MAKSKTLETAFEELEDLIRQMENKETSLEESFKLYTAGMKLVNIAMIPWTKWRRS